MDAPYESALTRSAIVLDEVERALARLDAGTYGTCETCGDSILSSDLSFDPTRRHCAEHKPAGWTVGSATPAAMPRWNETTVSTATVADAAPGAPLRTDAGTVGTEPGEDPDSDVMAEQAPNAPYDQYEDGS